MTLSSLVTLDEHRAVNPGGDTITIVLNVSLLHGRAGPLPLDEGPDLRARRRADIHRGEAAGRLFQVGHRGIALAVRVQQVGHVRVQGRDPVLVSELAAELERFGREGECLGIGPVSASSRARLFSAATDAPSSGSWRASARLSRRYGLGGGALPGPRGQHAEHVERLGLVAPGSAAA